MKDKCLMLCSPLGSHSRLRKPYTISDLKDDGTLDIQKLDSMVDEMSSMGANMRRAFPFLIGSEDDLRLLSPFHIDAFDNIIFHDQFFEIHRARAEAHRKKNQRYCYGMFENCWTMGSFGLFNPWRVYQNFFYDSKARKNILLYMDKVFRTFEGGLKAWVYFDQCNEIRVNEGELSTKSGKDKISFLVDTFCHMVDSKIAWQQIMLSVDYFAKETIPVYGALYRNFRNGVCDRYNDKAWETWLKTECISPIHGASLENVKTLFGEYTETTEDDAGAGGFRNMCFSTDGWKNPRPDDKKVEEMVGHVMDVKSVSFKNGRISFEIILGKTETDPAKSFLGLERAYFKRTGTHLENYRDGSTPQPPPPPGKTVEERLTRCEDRLDKLEGK